MNYEEPTRFLHERESKDGKIFMKLRTTLRKSVDNKTNKLTLRLGSPSLGNVNYTIMNLGILQEIRTISR